MVSGLKHITLPLEADVQEAESQMHLASSQNAWKTHSSWGQARMCSRCRQRVIAFSNQKHPSTQKHIWSGVTTSLVCMHSQQWSSQSQVEPLPAGTKLQFINDARDSIRGKGKRLAAHKRLWATIAICEWCLSSACTGTRLGAQYGLMTMSHWEVQLYAVHP